MSDTTINAKPLNDLIDTVTEFGVKVARAGTTILMTPMVFLPAETRSDAIDTAGEVAQVIGKLNHGVVNAAINGVNSVLKTVGDSFAPKAS